MVKTVVPKLGVCLGVVLLVLLTDFSMCYGQPTQRDDVVYLKNGSIMRGTIIEQVPGKSLKIETKDGDVFLITLDEVDHFTMYTARHSASATPHAKNVKRGDKLRVTLYDERRVGGKFYAGTPDSISIRNGSSYQWLRMDDIWSVEKRKGHTLSGFLLGSAIGVAIGGYFYDQERKAEEERFKREQEAYDAWWRRRFGSGVSSYDAKSYYDTKSLRYYPTPPGPPKDPNLMLILGPMLGGAVLGALTGNFIHTYKSIDLEWSVNASGYGGLSDWIEPNYNIKLQFRI